MSPLVRILAALVGISILAAAPAAQGEPPGATEAERKAIAEAKALEQKYGAQLQPNAWFAVADLDLGTFSSAQTVSGTFEFRNPRDAAVVWSDIKGSCTCAKVVIRVGGRTFELTSKPRLDTLVRIDDAEGQEVRVPATQIDIGPGEAGVVEAFMEIPATPGPRQAFLDIHTTDAALPQLKLRWRARSAIRHSVVPERVDLQRVAVGRTYDFKLTATSSLQPDFEITGMEDAGTEFEVGWQKSMNGGAATWTITGKYRPTGLAEPGRALTFHTNVAGGSSFDVVVTAVIDNPIRVTPSAMLPFGMVRSGKGASRTVTLEATDGRRLEVGKLTLADLSVDAAHVRVTSRSDGDKVVVEVAIAETAPRGLVKGEVVVELDNPLVPQQRILFNGYVR